MERGVRRVSGDLLKKLSYAFSLGLEWEIVNKGRVQVNRIQRFDSGAVLHHRRASRQGVDKPGLASNVAGVQDGFPVTLEH